MDGDQLGIVLGDNPGGRGAPIVQPARDAWNKNNWLSICISGDLFEQSGNKAIVKRPPLLMIARGTSWDVGGR
jgi:hypothetical protein